MAKIFKTDKMKLFLIIFIISILFFSSKTFNVSATGLCSSGCYSDTLGKNCTWDNEFFGGNAYTCSINTSQTISGPSIMPNGNCVDNTNHKVCVRALPCPSTFNDPLANGASCEIRSADGWIGCTSILQKSGKWDASQSQCVHCSGQMADRVYNVSGSSATDVAITPKCESACGGASDDQPTCAPVCIRTNPTVNSIPTSQTKPAGTAATYSISVANNDSAFSCADNSTFTLTLSGCPGGWTCSIAGSVSAQAGSSSLPTNLTIQSSAVAIPGATGTITITATHGADNTKTGSRSVTYIVASASALSVNISPGSIPASTPRLVTFYVRHPDTTIATNADVDLSTGQSCNTTTTGFCSITVNSAVDVTVIASKTGYTDGTTTIIVTSSCGAPASCVGCADGVACTGGTCYGEVCTPTGALCSSIMCGAANTVPCVCGTGGPTLSAPNVWCGFTPLCNPGQGFATQIACQTACLGAVPTCAAGDGCLAGCIPPDPDCAAVIPAASCSGPGMFVSPLGPGYCTIGEILTKATNWILALVSSIIILIIIIGGLMYISSAGDEEKLRTSKNIIFYAVIGLGIILISYALITEVTDILKGP